MKLNTMFKTSLMAMLALVALTITSTALPEATGGVAIITGLDDSYPTLEITYNYAAGSEKIIYTRDGEFHFDFVAGLGELKGVTILGTYTPIGEKAEAKDGGVIVTYETIRNADGTITIRTTITQP